MNTESPVHLPIKVRQGDRLLSFTQEFPFRINLTLSGDREDDSGHLVHSIIRYELDLLDRNGTYTIAYSRGVETGKIRW